MKYVSCICGIIMPDLRKAQKDFHDTGLFGASGYKNRRNGLLADREQACKVLSLI